MSILTGIIHSALDGYQRIGERNLISLTGSIFYLLIAYGFVKIYGLIGLGIAQGVYSAVLLLVSWIVLLKISQNYQLIPWRWDKLIFKEIIGYSIKIQMTGILAILLEPLTKGYLSKFGGLSSVGYFELAIRMVGQIRSLLISLNLIVLPIVASQHEIDSSRNKELYLTSYRIIFYLSIPIYAGLFSIIPIIAEYWIGYREPIFISMAYFITVGAFINSLSNPAYFVNLGIGNPLANMYGHVVMAASNAIFGYFLGEWFSYVGVSLAYVISISLGSLYILIIFHINEKIPLKKLFDKEDYKYLLISILSIATSIIIYRIDIIGISNAVIDIICIGAASFILLINIYFNSSCRKILKVIINAK